MPPRIPSPFGVPWNRLDLDAVKAFLTQREDESLTWEAKGGEIRPHHIREAASAFGNSLLGGLLLLGVTQNKATHEWTADGWVPPEPEVDLWVHNCLDNDGVTPKPSIEVKSWPLDDGGIVAGVAIWPVAVPPVITAVGQVWERTSSKSVKVTDPTDLRRLFERGEAARARARQRSNEAADELFAIERTRGQPACALGFSAASLPSEMAAEVFRQSVLEWLAENVKALHRRHVASNLAGMVRYNADWNQAGITFWTNDGFAQSESYNLRFGRDGRVALTFRDPDMGGAIALPEPYGERLRAMWQTGRALLDRLGAIGEIHIAARFHTKHGITAATSWSDMTSDGHEELDAIIRDVQRALGQAGWEPEERAAD